ncbi:MAG: hypothetical protein R3B53_01290 [Candidatus Paceibacterota bacterium]
MKKLEKYIPFRNEVAQVAVLNILACTKSPCSLVVLRERIVFLWPDYDETELVNAFSKLAWQKLLSTSGDLSNPHEFYLHLTT